MPDTLGDDFGPWAKFCRGRGKTEVVGGSLKVLDVKAPGASMPLSLYGPPPPCTRSVWCLRPQLINTIHFTPHRAQENVRAIKLRAFCSAFARASSP